MMRGSEKLGEWVDGLCESVFVFISRHQFEDVLPERETGVRGIKVEECTYCTTKVLMLRIKHTNNTVGEEATYARVLMLESLEQRNKVRRKNRTLPIKKSPTMKNQCQTAHPTWYKDPTPKIIISAGAEFSLPFQNPLLIAHNPHLLRLRQPLRFCLDR